ncbi:MAG: cyclic nucleotide-binding domain-containing protein, partial [Acidimicrobiales bacterium]
MATTVSGVSDDRAREQREVVQAMPLFAELTADELDDLVARCQTGYAPAGTWCVRAGDPSDALYIVVYGRLQVYVDD